MFLEYSQSWNGTRTRVLTGDLIPLGCTWRTIPNPRQIKVAVIVLLCVVRYLFLLIFFPLFSVSCCWSPNNLLELPRSSLPSQPRSPVTLPSSYRHSAGVAADQGAPGAPAHLESAHLSARYVTLAWSAPDQAGASPVVGYTVYWKEVTSDRLIFPSRVSPWPWSWP